MRRRPNQVFHSVSPDCPPGTIIRFSRQLIEENSCAIWKVRKSPLWNNSCGGRPVMSSPSMSTVPEVGGSAPAITLKSVVLPAPLGPTRPVIDPLAISMLAPSTARNAPK